MTLREIRIDKRRFLAPENSMATPPPRTRRAALPFFLVIPSALRVGAALMILLAALPALAQAPQRVVSLNLCTDQLAMLLAAPGQLVSVTALAGDARSSLMFREASGFAQNSAQAEEIYLLRPDLVLASTYSAQQTLDMLRRLGIRVETLPPSASVADVRQAITQVGEWLGAEDRAAALLERFDADLATLPYDDNGPLAATYDANGYTAGRLTLAGDVLRHAGYALMTDRISFDHGGPLPLELLVLNPPELLVGGTRYEHSSRAEDILDHPVLSSMGTARFTVPDRDWICGLPHIAQVAANLLAVPLAPNTTP